MFDVSKQLLIELIGWLPILTVLWVLFDLLGSLIFWRE